MSFTKTKIYTRPSTEVPFIHELPISDEAHQVTLSLSNARDSALGFVSREANTDPTGLVYKIIETWDSPLDYSKFQSTQSTLVKASTRAVQAYCVTNKVKYTVK